MDCPQEHLPPQRSKSEPDNKNWEGGGSHVSKCRKHDQGGKEGGSSRTGQRGWSSKPKQQVMGKIKHLKMKTKWEEEVSLESLMWALGSKEAKNRGLCLQVTDEEEETTKSSRLERDQPQRDPWMLQYPDQTGQRQCRTRRHSSGGKSEGFQ